MVDLIGDPLQLPRDNGTDPKNCQYGVRRGGEISSGDNSVGLRRIRQPTRRYFVIPNPECPTSAHGVAPCTGHRGYFSGYRIPF